MDIGLDFTQPRHTSDHYVHFLNYVKFQDDALLYLCSFSRFLRTVFSPSYSLTFTVTISEISKPDRILIFRFSICLISTIYPLTLINNECLWNIASVFKYSTIFSFPLPRNLTLQVSGHFRHVRLAALVMSVRPHGEARLPFDGVL
jgi:hypothetical protein